MALITGLSYLGTITLYTAGGYGIVNGLVGAYRGCEVVQSILVDDEIEDSSMIQGFFGSIVGGLGGFVVCGIYGTVKGSLVPINFILYTTQYSMSSLISLGEATLQTLGITSRTVIEIIEFDVTLSQRFSNDDNYKLIMISKSDSDIKPISLEVTQDIFGNFKSEDRDVLMSGKSLKMACATIVSTLHMSPKKVLEVYYYLKKQKNNVHLIREDGIYSVISIPHDCSISMQKITNDWKCHLTCYLCDNRFGYLYGRRHHCRLCGLSICDECTKELYSLKESDKIKTCSSCYDSSILQEDFYIKFLRKVVKKLEEESD